MPNNQCMKTTTNPAPGSVRARIHTIGFDHGRAIIAASMAENGPATFGACTECSQPYTWVVPDYNIEPHCADCWVDDMEYCEDRWGTVTEHANIDEHRQPRTAAEYMRGVEAGIRDAFPKDGPR